MRQRRGLTHELTCLSSVGDIVSWFVQMFRALVLALALGVATAFVPVAPKAARTASLKVTQEELQDLAESNRDALGEWVCQVSAYLGLTWID